MDAIRPAEICRCPVPIGCPSGVYQKLGDKTVSLRMRLSRKRGGDYDRNPSRSSVDLRAAHADRGYIWNPCKHWRWTPSDRLIYFAARSRLGAYQGCTKNWETKLSPFECAYPEKGAEIMTETHPGQVWTCEQHMQTADISGTPVN